MAICLLGCVLEGTLIWVYQYFEFPRSFNLHKFLNDIAGLLFQDVTQS